MQDNKRSGRSLVGGNKLFSPPDHILHLSSPNPWKLMYQALSYPLDLYKGKIFKVILIGNSYGTVNIVVINAHHIVLGGKGLKGFSGLIIGCYTEYLTRDLTEMLVNHLYFRQIQKQEVPVGWCSSASVPVQCHEVVKYLYSILIFSSNRMRIIQSIRREWKITINDLMVAVLTKEIKM